MTQCPRCESAVPDGARFCIRCGAPTDGGDDGPMPALTQADVTEVRELRRLLGGLSARLAVIEARATAAPAAITPAGTVAVETAPAGVATPALPPPVAEWPQAPTEPAAPTFAAEPPAPAVYVPSEPALADRVMGLNWFAIVGAIALVAGMGFFLKLAIDSNWIGPVGQILLGLATGAALLAAGEVTQRRYAAWAHATSGGGIATLYLSTYAAFAFYALVDAPLAFMFLSLVVALSGALALRYESMLIALMGIGGAFYTPRALGSQLDDQRVLLGYLLLVDFGILGVSTFRNWRWFTLLGLVGSYGLFGMWLAGPVAVDALFAQAGLTGVFLVFAGATTLFHVLWRRTPNMRDQALIVLNAGAYYSFSYGLLWYDYRLWFGAFTVALSLFYGMIGYGALKRREVSPRVPLFAMAIALLFLVIAVPVQLTGSWITVAWATLGVTLVGLGFLLGSGRTRLAGLAVVALAVAKLLLLDGLVQRFVPFILVDAHALTTIAVLAAIYLAAYLYARRQGANPEPAVLRCLLYLGSALTLYFLMLKVDAFFDMARLVALVTATGVYVSPSERMELLRAIALSEATLITLVWAAYAFVLLLVASVRRNLEVRLAATTVLLLATAKLLGLDLWLPLPDPSTFQPVANPTFVSAALLLLLLVYARRLARWVPGPALGLVGRAPALLLAAACVLGLLVLSAEVLRYYAAGEAMHGAVGMAAERAKHLTLTVLWALYAVGLLAAGIVARVASLRQAGVAWLAVPVGKLFVFDVFLLNEGYRVAAFVVLGVLLLCTGLAYQRYSTRIRGFLLNG